MKNKFGRLNAVTYLILGVVSLIMGIILIINPKFTLTGLCSVVGAVLLIAGTIMMILYFAKAEYKNHQSAEFAVTLFLILAGIIVMVRKEDISDIFPQFLALVVLISGVFKMQQSMDLVGMQDMAWSRHFLIGLVIVVLSGIVLVIPDAAWFRAEDRIPLYLCILLIVDGFLSIGCLLHATQRKKQYQKMHPDEFVEVIEDKDARERRR